MLYLEPTWPSQAGSGRDRSGETRCPLGVECLYSRERGVAVQHATGRWRDAQGTTGSDRQRHVDIRSIVVSWIVSQPNKLWPGCRQAHGPSLQGVDIAVRIATESLVE